MSVFNTKDVSKRMDGAIEALKREFAGLRTGRASPSLLEGVTVDAYGAMSPLVAVAAVSAPEARLLSVQVWDRNMVKAVEKAIRESGLGLNPQTEGATIRVPIPELNQERRTELAKVAAKYAEEAKVAVRNVRRDGMEELKKLEKDGDMGKDDARRFSDEVQKLTDTHVSKIDELLTAKQEEIRQV